MTGVNYLFPWIISVVDNLERWDFAAEILSADLVKNYYTSMLNIVFFMVIQLYKLKTEDSIEGTDYECKEDAFTDEFLKLLTGELVLRGAYYLYWNTFLKLKGRAKTGFDWRTEFELSDEFVWFLTIQLVMWSAMLTYPIIALVCLAFSWCHCTFLIYRLTNQKVQPQMASNDMSTGSLMNMYLNFTFMIACAFYSAFLFDKMPRSHYYVDKLKVFDTTKWCGPFRSNNAESPFQEVGLFPTDGSIQSRFAFCFLLQFSVYTILYMISYNAQTHIGILGKVRDLKFKEYEQKIRELQEKLNKLDMKEKLLRQNRRL